MTTRRSRENASSILRTFSVCAPPSAECAPAVALRACFCTLTSLVVSTASAAKLSPNTLAMTSCGRFRCWQV
jgi:hypothetical protein